MNIRSSVLSVLISLSAVAQAYAAAPPSLPLEGGTYVIADAGTACEAVANAGTLYIVSGNVIFPHDHEVHSVVTSVSPDGSQYTLHSTFTSYKVGGEPFKSARTSIIKVNDASSFELLDGKGKSSSQSFHRCGPAPKLI